MRVKAEQRLFRLWSQANRGMRTAEEQTETHGGSKDIVGGHLYLSAKEHQVIQRTEEQWG
jgi:hypothetical protein